MSNYQSEPFSLCSNLEGSPEHVLAQGEDERMEDNIDNIPVDVGEVADEMADLDVLNIMASLWIHHDTAGAPWRR